MTIQEVTQVLEELSPLYYAENFDNVGLLVGNPSEKVKGILVTLDTLENVIDEAKDKGCNLIVSFHPIIFSGLKQLTGTSYVERVVIKAIKNNIAIYSIHTALDNSIDGVNAKICEILNINDPQILIPQKSTIKKLTTYVPENNAESLKKSLFKAGAGHIGNYSNCSFAVKGLGSFKPNEKAKPSVGKVGQTNIEKEVQLNFTFAAHLESLILKTLFKKHPYEEVAYEITTLENNNQKIGMGMIGHLDKEMDETSFFKLLKEKMNAPVIRHSELLGKPIKKIAVLGGSGAFAIGAAINAKADIYVTADVKYHEFYKAEGKMVIADIGHFETEQFTKNLLADFLTKKIPNFAVTLSKSITNPIKYF
ncbi:MAG: Nif3-like dinuclear metal center hexameric protein [Croceitalea sp.]|nr:Nif3-like dinuclear metal center hexameric protein [Croceitalea sp.]NNM18847.1 Nif3-like dinuclear metal center hexameric protein [Croceitalea sp.]